MNPHALRILEYARVREILTAYATTSLGRAAIARIEPLADAAAIRTALEEVEECRRFQRGRRLPLGSVAEVTPAVRALAEGGRPAEPDLLHRTVELLRAAESLRAALTALPAEFPRLAAVGAGLEGLPLLRLEIETDIDPRGEVRDEASPRLREVRSRVHERRESLRAKSQARLSDPRLRQAFQSEGVTIKDDRYLLPVKADYRSWVHGVIRDRSQSGQTLYIESEEWVLEGDELLDLLDHERDEVRRILWELTRRVLAEEAKLRAIEERIGRIDLIASKAGWAEAFGLEAPVIGAGAGAGMETGTETGTGTGTGTGVGDWTLELREARHPYLLWLRRDTSRGPREDHRGIARGRIVPMDIRLGERFRLLIITGPNTGGKTVALKTIGLSVLMALSGIPIAAAAGSRVPVYADLFADIGDEQSLEQSLSTFSSHLTQIGEVLRSADDRSLILLDELGSGTDPIEGAALGAALLDYFRARGWQAIITTHLGSLKEYAFVHDGAENAAMEFDPASLRPTYRLILGLPGRSNALSIARRLGIPPEVVERAEEAISRSVAPAEEILGRMERSARRAERERRRAERQRRRAQGAARALEEKSGLVDAERAALRDEAEKEVETRVREARDRLLPIVQRLKSVPKTHLAAVEELERAILEAISLTTLGQRREEFARGLRKDEEVYVPRFKERCRVKKINKAERLLTVLVNGIPTEIGFDDVSWVG